MESQQLQQLADLLSSVNAVNGGSGQLYIGEAIVYDASDKPIAKLEFNENGTELVLKEILASPAA